jgi:hypothetical protein
MALTPASQARKGSTLRDCCFVLALENQDFNFCRNVNLQHKYPEKMKYNALLCPPHALAVRLAARLLRDVAGR